MKKILYAEDNVGMRKMVSHFLDASGFLVVACEDGDEAIELARHEIFDIIILDVTMERVDGLEAARQIRNLNNPNAKLPIFGLTARSEKHEIMECKNAGMDLVIPKPVDLEELALSILNAGNHESEEVVATDNKNINPEEPQIIDVSVLTKYYENTGPEAVSGVLRDFSKHWPVKISELLLHLTMHENDAFIRSAEELSAIAAGIGAGKILKYASMATSIIDENQRMQILLEIINSCKEVQKILDKLNEDYMFLAA